MVLRLTAYVMFLALIAIFAYIIYRYAGKVSAMMFTALMANLSPDAYTYFITPEWHEGTLISTGIFIILLNFDSVKKSSIYRTLACAIATGLVMLSESMFLALFIIPYIAYYAMFERAGLQKSVSKKKFTKRTDKALDQGENNLMKKMDVRVLSMAIVPFITWLFKT